MAEGLLAGTGYGIIIQSGHVPGHPGENTLPGGREDAMVDIFDILGPIMVGPSSSHTAGAVRIGP